MSVPRGFVYAIGLSNGLFQLSAKVECHKSVIVIGSNEGISNQNQSTRGHALRSQEARTLRLADIDPENSTIAIARVKGSRSGVQSLDRHRGEPILDEVLALRSWLRERIEDGSRILFDSGPRHDPRELCKVRACGSLLSA
jgi:hypothetical protein